MLLPRAMLCVCVLCVCLGYDDVKCVCVYGCVCVRVCVWPTALQRAAFQSGADKLLTASLAHADPRGRCVCVSRAREVCG